jgi:hypothetical protein
VASTGGLIERRGENIDAGLGQLAVAAASPAPLDELITAGGPSSDEPEDDIGI